VEHRVWSPQNFFHAEGKYFLGRIKGLFERGLGSSPHLARRAVFIFAENPDKRSSPLHILYFVVEGKVGFGQLLPRLSQRQAVNYLRFNVVVRITGFGRGAYRW
jgi:hypothetical protein